MFSPGERGRMGISGPMFFPEESGYFWYQVPCIQGGGYVREGRALTLWGGYVQGAWVLTFIRGGYVQMGGYSIPRSEHSPLPAVGTHPRPLQHTVNKRAVRILLECFLVKYTNVISRK